MSEVGRLSEGSRRVTMEELASTSHPVVGRAVEVCALILFPIVLNTSDERHVTRADSWPKRVSWSTSPAGPPCFLGPAGHAPQGVPFR
ncbi:hypothetical protein E2C01_027069 [Portunus trituberculatus]|uniref:Uncharacterized protein n=1 Tax=Portunus trituberculatus TaxID=210409 RepID=A0A5B7EH73_PORTR|nr:hypothetical protein [Portunus trituberculatus]